MDCVPKGLKIRQLRVEYKKQVRLHEVLTPYVSRTETGAYVVVLKNREDEICCVVELECREV